MYPSVSHASTEFTLLTGASAVGVGAVLEQDGHVIAYASRSLTQSERQYSEVQRVLGNCLCCKKVSPLPPSATVHDHAPLQWLSSQKMEGMLCTGIQLLDFI